MNRTLAICAATVASCWLGCCGRSSSSSVPAVSVWCLWLVAVASNNRASHHARATPIFHPESRHNFPPAARSLELGAPNGLPSVEETKELSHHATATRAISGADADNAWFFSGACRGARVRPIAACVTPARSLVRGLSEHVRLAEEAKHAGGVCSAKRAELRHSARPTDQQPSAWGRDGVHPFGNVLPRRSSVAEHRGLLQSRDHSSHQHFGLARPRRHEQQRESKGRQRDPNDLHGASLRSPDYLAWW